jgi:GTP-binding protein
VLLVDASEGVHAQDLRIAAAVWERGAGLIIAVNKWDLIEDKDTGTAKRGQEDVADRAAFLEAVPFLYVSALTGQRVRQVLERIIEVAAERERRVPTADVNRVLRALAERNQPPQHHGQEVKLLYGSQVGTRPPTFALVVSRPKAIPEAYRRYLERGFRSAWGFRGSPLRIRFRARRSNR